MMSVPEKKCYCSGFGHNPACPVAMAGLLVALRNVPAVPERDMGLRAELDAKDAEIACLKAEVETLKEKTQVYRQRYQDRRREVVERRMEINEAKAAHDAEIQRLRKELAEAMAGAQRWCNAYYELRKAGDGEHAEIARLKALHASINMAQGAEIQRLRDQLQNVETWAHAFSEMAGKAEFDLAAAEEELEKLRKANDGPDMGAGHNVRSGLFNRVDDHALDHRLGIAMPEGEPCEPRPTGARWRAMV
jgi:DNA repair exonuclease SbcCD ATPase subunit